MIEGVLEVPLKVFSDERGKLMHMLRCDASFFKRFGEIYFSTVNSGIVKGWKRHAKMTQHFAVPVGNVKLVIYDDRKGSPTAGEIQELAIGEKNYKLVRIPPQVWYAFAALGDKPVMIANCTDMPHDPNESASIGLDDKSIPYKWSLKGI